MSGGRPNALFEEIDRALSALRPHTSWTKYPFMFQLLHRPWFWLRDCDFVVGGTAPLRQNHTQIFRAQDRSRDRAILACLEALEWSLLWNRTPRTELYAGVRTRMTGGLLWLARGGPIPHGQPRLGVLRAIIRQPAEEDEWEVLIECGLCLRRDAREIPVYDESLGGGAERSQGSAPAGHSATPPSPGETGTAVGQSAPAVRATAPPPLGSTRERLDYFAGQALAGLLANSRRNWSALDYANSAEKHAQVLLNVLDANAAAIDRQGSR